ncbi:MAG: metallophosphoesterase family protein [Desulforhopalus sp.]
MRLAIFGDIHGNIEALEAVVDDMQKRGIDRYICLGDLVGYGANPNECIDLVRSLANAVVVLGNHDAAVTWDTTPYGMSKSAQKAIFFTMDALTKGNMSFLKTLQPLRVMGRMVFSHANPYNPKAWRYVNSRKYAARTFAATGRQMVFIGHTHKPLIITKKNFFQIAFETPDTSVDYPINSRRSQIFNCGSVGQSRDGTPKASYITYDTRKQQLTFHRVAFDCHKAADKILAAGLPPSLAKRLVKGV